MPSVGFVPDVCPSISGLSIANICFGAVPFLLANVVVLARLATFPEPSTWLPALIMN